MTQTARDEQTFLNELDKKLWTSADKLCSNLDAAVYKHAVLGLIFLKYVSDAFVERRTELKAQFTDPNDDYYLDPGDYDTAEDYETELESELELRDYYLEKNVFWVPELARWSTLQGSAKLGNNTVIPLKNAQSYTFRGTGKLIEDALDAIEKENPNSKQPSPLSTPA